MSSYPPSRPPHSPISRFVSALDQSSFRSALVGCIYLIIYVSFAKISEPWTNLPGLDICYPQAGLTLALLLIFGERYIPWVILAPLLCNLGFHFQTIPAWNWAITSVIDGIGYTLTSYFLKKKFKFNWKNFTTSIINSFVLTSLTVSLILSNLTILLWASSGLIPWTSYFWFTLNLWTCNALSLIIIVPFVLIDLPKLLNRFKTISRPTLSRQNHLFNWSIESYSFSFLIQIFLTILFISLVILVTPNKSSLHLIYFGLSLLIWMLAQKGLEAITTALFLSNLTVVFLGYFFAIDFSALSDFKIFVLTVSTIGLLAGTQVQEKNKLQQELLASKIQFQQLVENIPQVFWIGTTEGREFFYVSPAYQEIWGRSCQSLYKNPNTWLESIHPQDREKVISEIIPTLGNPTSVEYRIVRPDGSTRWILDSRFPITNSWGEVERLAGIAQDITDQKQIEEEVFKTIEKQREISEIRTRLITTTSHEFRTPLTTIFSAAELLEYYSQQWTETEKVEYLRQIQEAVNHMTQMLDDILFLSHAEAKRLQFEPVEFELVEFCQEILESLKQEMQPLQSLIFQPQSEEITVCMDRKLIQLILQNLLSNAIKYSPDNSQVHFEVELQDKEIIFKIQDTGIGILVEDQARLFKSFHRGKNVGNISGTGVGLSVVKKCVELHEGKISFKSQEGVGTTFVVQLPSAS